MLKKTILVLCIIASIAKADESDDEAISKKKYCGDLCSRVLCMKPECCPDEVLIPGDGDCNCCPSCVIRNYTAPHCKTCRIDCNRAKCDEVRCGEDEIYINGDGNCNCCPRCEKQADYPFCTRCNPEYCLFAKCLKPVCTKKEIYVPHQPGDCNCCGHCVPRRCDPKKCAVVRCKDPNEIRDSCDCDSVFVPADGDCNCCGKCVKIIK